jgi:hypothetical protein
VPGSARSTGSCDELPSEMDRAGHARQPAGRDGRSGLALRRGEHIQTSSDQFEVASRVLVVPLGPLIRCSMIAFFT